MTCPYQYYPAVSGPLRAAQTIISCSSIQQTAIIFYCRVQHFVVNSSPSSNCCWRPYNKSYITLDLWICNITFGKRRILHIYSEYFAMQIDVQKRSKAKKKKMSEMHTIESFFRHFLCKFVSSINSFVNNLSDFPFIYFFAKLMECADLYYIMLKIEEKPILYIIFVHSISTS